VSARNARCGPEHMSWFNGQWPKPFLCESTVFIICASLHGYAARLW
jgi:hypothetical protein